MAFQCTKTIFSTKCLSLTYVISLTTCFLSPHLLPLAALPSHLSSLLFCPRRGFRSSVRGARFVGTRILPEKEKKLRAKRWKICSRSAPQKFAATLTNFAPPPLMIIYPFLSTLETILFHIGTSLGTKLTH